MMVFIYNKSWKSDVCLKPTNPALLVWILWVEKLEVSFNDEGKT